MTITSIRAGQSVADRIAELDWDALTEQLDEQGFAKTPTLLRAGECEELAATFGEDDRFRSTIDMNRHRFGEGQ